MTRDPKARRAVFNRKLRPTLPGQNGSTALRHGLLPCAQPPAQRQEHALGAFLGLAPLAWVTNHRMTHPLDERGHGGLELPREFDCFCLRR